MLALRIANRDFLAPYDPIRGEEFFTLEAQLERLRRTEHAYGIVENGAIVGSISLTNVVYGPLQSANVGYWVDRAHTNRGLATAALAEILDVAFGELGLHRVEAGTLVDNVASQRVLEKNRFTRIGLARRHLLIGGEWRDHILFERLADD